MEIVDAAEAHRPREIGYPLLIKARSGGGGRGIRRVDRLEDVESAVLNRFRRGAERVRRRRGVYGKAA